MDEMVEMGWKGCGYMLVLENQVIENAPCFDGVFSAAPSSLFFFLFSC